MTGNDNKSGTTNTADNPNAESQSVFKTRVESIRAFFKQDRNKADARQPISKTPTKRQDC